MAKNRTAVVGSAVKFYMQIHVVDYVDALTGEVDSTHLAEDACSHFNLYENSSTWDIPGELFDLAELISTRHEMIRGVIELRNSVEIYKRIAAFDTFVFEVCNG